MIILIKMKLLIFWSLLENKAQKTLIKLEQAYKISHILIRLDKKCYNIIENRNILMSS